MRRELIAVFDNKAKDVHGGLIQIATHRVEAMRGFQALISNDKTDYARYPEDFDLVSLGYLDPTTGHIVSHQINFDELQKPMSVTPLFETIITGLNMKAIVEANKDAVIGETKPTIVRGDK